MIDVNIRKSNGKALIPSSFIKVNAARGIVYRGEQKLSAYARALNPGLKADTIQGRYPCVPLKSWTFQPHAKLLKSTISFYDVAGNTIKQSQHI